MDAVGDEPSDDRTNDIVGVVTDLMADHRQVTRSPALVAKTITEFITEESLFAGEAPALGSTSEAPFSAWFNRR